MTHCVYFTLPRQIRTLFRNNNSFLNNFNEKKLNAIMRELDMCPCAPCSKTTYEAMLSKGVNCLTLPLALPVAVNNSAATATHLISMPAFANACTTVRAALTVTGYKLLLSHKERARTCLQCKSKAIQNDNKWALLTIS